MIDQDLLITAEFRGLFFGEGCIHVVKQKRRDIKWESYWVRLSVSQRMDNCDLLFWLRDQFGGRIVGRRHDQRGTWSASWQLADKVAVRRCLEILLGGSCPSVKRQQAKLALEFMDTIRSKRRPGLPALHYYTAEERVLRTALYEQFKAAKKFDQILAANYREGPIQ